MEKSGHIEVLRSNIREAEIVHTAPPVPGTGEIVVEIERFSLTANNVTYAAAGDVLGYWQFFPASRPGFGIVPVWGFGRVAASAVDDIRPGERLYGYWPMATHAILRPGHVSKRNFSDISEHRAGLAAIYNSYQRLGREKRSARNADLRALLQPLLVTSWLLFDFLTDNHWFGAEQVIIGSASSKTGIGLAKYIDEVRPDSPKIVGLTSPANRAFVQSLGAYDQVIAYDKIVSEVSRVPTVFVDMAGNAAVRAALHGHLGDLMLHSAAVGTSHWDKFAPTGDLPGAKPQFFFAPTQYTKREAEIGADAIQRKIADAWQRLARGSSTWLKIQHAKGLKGALEFYSNLAAGKMTPDKAHVVVM